MKGIVFPKSVKLFFPLKSASVQVHVERDTIKVIGFKTVSEEKNADNKDSKKIKVKNMMCTTK